jgi:hypothetical protein
MTSTTDQLATFMSEHKITGTVAYTGLSHDGEWTHHAFRANLDIDGEMYLHNTPYSAARATTPPA